MAGKFILFRCVLEIALAATRYTSISGTGLTDNGDIGYLAWEYPTNRLLQRLPLGKYSAACIIIWGLILSCFAGVKSYAGAIAIRLFLGVFEAAVTPGFALITSQVCLALTYSQCTNDETSY